MAKIELIWCTEDVLEVAPDLTENEATRALYMAKKYHDAEVGVNWDTLRIYAGMVRDERNTPNEDLLCIQCGQPTSECECV